MEMLLSSRRVNPWGPGHREMLPWEGEGVVGVRIAVFLRGHIDLAPQSVVCEPAALASPQNMLDIQNLGPLPDLLNQNLPVNKKPRWSRQASPCEDGGNGSERAVLQPKVTHSLTELYLESVLLTPMTHNPDRQGHSPPTVQGREEGRSGLPWSQPLRTACTQSASEGQACAGMSRGA